MLSYIINLLVSCQFLEMETTQRKYKGTPSSTIFSFCRKAQKTQRRWENGLFAIVLKYGQLMQK